jgi:hypothetical protein
MTLHLTRSSRLWDTFTPRTGSVTVSMEIHKGAILGRLKINVLFTDKTRINCGQKDWGAIS